VFSGSFKTEKMLSAVICILRIYQPGWELEGPQVPEEDKAIMKSGSNISCLSIPIPQE
jgi:hypothetical protein